MMKKAGMARTTSGVNVVKRFLITQPLGTSILGCIPVSQT